MGWALWLAVPVLATLLAALWSWVRSRPRRLPDTAESMRAHSAYLDALGASTHSHAGSSPPSQEPSPTPPAETAEHPATSE